MNPPELLTDAAPFIDGVVFDAGTIAKAEVTDSGFLRAPARITRTGVFVYVNPDGSLRRELRLPEEVFAEDSLRTLRLVPLTREHPLPLGTAVTKENRKDLDVGVVGSDVHPDEIHVAATVQVEDTEAIAEVQTGKRRELSAAYTRRLELSPGVWNGIPYDGIQRNIRYNHVALTVSGRAGPEDRIRLDSKAAVMVCDASEATNPQATEASPMKRKITVDGITYEIECEDSTAAVIQKAIADRDARITSLDSKVSEAVKRAEVERARADNAETEAKKAQALVADSTSPAKIQEAVKARLDLERAVKPLLTVDGKEPDLAALTDADIKRKVVLVHDSDAKLDGVSAEYLEGRYAGAVKALAAAKGAATQARAGAVQAATAPNAASRVVADSKAARDKLREESEAAWQKPLGVVSK